MSKKKKVISVIILGIVTLVIIGGLAYKNYYFIDEDEIVLKSDYVEQMKSDEEKRYDLLMEEMYGGEKNEKKYDLKETILADSKVTFEGIHTIKDTSIKCKIEAYDIYSYVIDNIEIMKDFKNAEEYTEYMKKSIKDGDIKRTTRELELPVEYKDNKLIVNNYSDEYKDAMLGGAYTLSNELHTKSIVDYMEDMYELNEYVKNLDFKLKGNETE